MEEAVLREQLAAQLTGGQAYPPVEKIVRGFPKERAGEKSGEVRHTGWELLEHLRISQWDILHFTRDPDYLALPWPDAYWPKVGTPPHSDAWDQTVEQFLADLEAVKLLTTDPDTRLNARIPHGEGQTYLREVLLVADHNAYHLGQLLQLQRALEAK